METKWHIGFCNLTITQYAGVTYRQYYADPAVMLEAQLKAKEVAERRFGAGAFIDPYVDGPNGTVSTLLGMHLRYPDEDELPFIDTAAPVVTDMADTARIRIGDPRTDGLMPARLRACAYYRQHGYELMPGGCENELVSIAAEISNNTFFMALLDNPQAAVELLDKVLEAEQIIARINDESSTHPSTDGYIGDDFAGLVSPRLFENHVIPYYEKLYAGKTTRFMHSELLRYEHLRICRDRLGITEFHGAGCEKLTLEEMHRVMGRDFWTQVTPHELCFFTPAELEEKIRIFADSGCSTVQLYPGRGTPERNMEAAIAAVRKFCRGGMRV